MTDERRVDMIRIERQEEFFDREEVLGRDLKSVFPKTAAQEESTQRQLNTEMIKEAIGARQFISETELAEIKKTRGGGAEDGSLEPLKPLVEVLREAKEAKEAAFQDQWKQMKTGKNRALEPDELAFIEALRDEEITRDRETRLQERQELDEYRRALEKMKEEAEASAAAAAPAAAPPSRKHPAGPAPKPTFKAVVKPAIKIMPKAAGGAASHAAAATAAAGTADGSPQGKRQKTEGAAGAPASNDDEDDSGGGLAGLLGEYGSDSE